MSKNGIVLLTVAVILGVIYAFYFTDWFYKGSIEIIPQVRPTRPSGIPRDPNTAPVYPVSFLLQGKFALTSVKVVSAEDLATNKYPTALWYMISDTNSVPTKSFLYGERIRGMKPAIPRARPEPLQPNITYTLVVEAGKLKGQTNFFTRELVQPSNQ